MVIFWILSISAFAEILVGKISFEGNNFVPDEKLSNSILTKSGNIFNQKILNDDAKNISKTYEKQGFYNIKVFSPKIVPTSAKTIDINFKIEEKKNPPLKQVFFDGNSYISDKDIQLKNINKDIHDIQKIISKIADLYALNGFLFANISIDSLQLVSDSLLVYLQIEEGKYCEFEEYKFSGNKVSKENSLLKISRLLLIKKITPKTLQQAALNVKRKQYIKNCQIIPLNHKQLLIQVEEDRMNRVSGIGGYNNSNNKNRFSGYFYLDFLNIYGTDRSLSLFWQHTTSNRSSIEISYHESGFNDIPISGDFLIFREEEDSTYIKTTFESETYYYNLYNKYGLFWGQDDFFPGKSNEQNFKKTHFSKFGFFVEQNKLDDYLNPTKGNKIYLKYYHIFNIDDEKNVRKQAVEFTFDKYFYFGRNFVLQTGLNANIIENKDLSEFENYSLGGNNNLRGFAEDQFAGYRVGWSNLELRYLLAQNSQFFIFADYGFVQNKNYTFGKLFGYGFGLRAETKLGILGIDYGLSYDECGNFRNPLDGIIHFGIETKL